MRHLGNFRQITACHYLANLTIMKPIGFYSACTGCPKKPPKLLKSPIVKIALVKKLKYLCKVRLFCSWNLHL